MDNRIKCGKCSSEYHPRKDEKTMKTDYACPVCGHGKVQESYFKPKSMLLDNRRVF